MNRILLHLCLLLLSSTAFSQTQSKLTMDQFTISTSGSTELENRKLLTLLNLFVQENYPKKAFPIHKATPFYLTDQSYSSPYNMHIGYGTSEYLGVEIEELKQGLKDGSISPLGLKIGINSSDINQILMQVEYAIKQEKKLKKAFWRIIKSHKNVHYIEISHEELRENIFLKPPSEKIVSFLDKYQKEIQD